jgi:hypothetical protein
MCRWGNLFTAFDHGDFLLATFLIAVFCDCCCCRCRCRFSYCCCCGRISTFFAAGLPPLGGLAARGGTGAFFCASLLLSFLPTTLDHDAAGSAPADVGLGVVGGEAWLAPLSCRVWVPSSPRVGGGRGWHSCWAPRPFWRPWAVSRLGASAPRAWSPRKPQLPPAVGGVPG